MKKTTKLLFSMIALVAVSTSCNWGKKNSSSSTAVSSSTTSISSSSTSSVPSSSTTSTQSSSSSQEVETPMPETAEVRNYDGRFDAMLDDFSSSTLSGTKSANAVHSSNPFLSVLVDSDDAVFPGTADASIYKMATGTYAIQNYEGIGFRLRVASGTISYDNLVLGLRGDDSFKLYELNLKDAVDADGEALPALSATYQDILISPIASIEDMDTVYQKTDNTPSTVKVIEQILGFHLYAKGNSNAVIEIEKVFLSLGGEQTVIDNFDRTNVNSADSTCWWRGSTGTISTRFIELKDNATYEVKNTQLTKDYSKVVLSIKGNSKGTTITPIYAANEGSPVAWSNLKDSSNVAVPTAVEADYYPLVIDFANSGITGTVIGVKVASSTQVKVNAIFLTNLEEPQLSSEYPLLGTDISEFDSFNGRVQTNFNGDYEASANSQVVKDAGLYYTLSYSNGNMVSVNNGVLTFDASELGGSYINYKSGSSHARNGMKYLVLSMKMVEGATLDNFRIKPSGDAVYANDWYAAEGLKSIPSENYPYEVDGFRWYIIDLEVSNLGEINDSLDLYYSGSGKLVIDRIFFAHDSKAAVKVANARIGGVDNVSLDTSAPATYQYLGNLNGSEDYLALTLIGDGVATLKSARIEPAGASAVWFKDNAIVDINGQIISSTAVIPTTSTTYYIDIEATFGQKVATDYHSHYGQFDGAMGIITLVKVDTYVKIGLGQGEIASNITVDMSDNGYHYVGGGFIYNSDVLYFTVTGDGVATFESIRIEFVGGSTIFINHGFKDLDGNVVDHLATLPTTPTTFYLDLTASDVDTANQIHVHSGQDGAQGTIIWNSIGYVYTTPNYSAVIGLIG